MEQTRTFTCIFKMVYYSWSKQQAAKQYMEQRMVMAIAWTREKRLPSVALTLTRLSLTLSRCNREPPWASTPTAAACRLRSDPAAQDISAPVPSHPRRPHRSSPPRLPEPRVPAAVTRAWPWRRQQELRPPPAMSSAGSCSPAPVPASSTPSSSSSEHELHRVRLPLSSLFFFYLFYSLSASSLNFPHLDLAAPAAALLRSSPSPPDPARPCVPSLVPATRSPRRTTGDQQRRRTPCPIPARVRAQETRQVASLQVSSSPVGHQHRAGFLGRSRRVHSRLRQVYIDMLKEQLLDVDTVPGRASSPSPARAASARPRSRARSTRAPRSATTSPYYTISVMDTLL
ncbi:putative uncharacterized protein ENSP00000383309 isoform X2 [Triticum aestivum]|uniref:putative uncharacterized protein ENSP00000383309 isoform X2 n=1 Tax=Triticum aestivum TaxID=4565 RepID=UPI001D00859A|nr:putative uncharacterized protein ENSP00000383309 isoform X2 [Triticum aestivum]XP_044370925.1 putative uncharacterized protein ENSP00000383309 isoform X2 [Triticum aestivum]